MKTTLQRLVPAMLLLAAFATGWMVRSSQAQTSSMIMNEAIGERDSRLNVVYKKLMASIPSASQKEKLKIAQRAWLAWLDAEDNMTTELFGTKHGLATRLELLSARVTQLEDLHRNSSDIYGARGR